MEISKEEFCEKRKLLNSSERIIFLIDNCKEMKNNWDINKIRKQSLNESKLKELEREWESFWERREWERVKERELEWEREFKREKRMREIRRREKVRKELEWESLGGERAKEGEG